MTAQDTTDRTDYMVDDHDPLDAAKALEAADLMMRQMAAMPSLLPEDDGRLVWPEDEGHPIQSAELTFEEQCALKALQQSRRELHMVRMTPSMAFDYCDLALRFPQFVNAIGSLIKKGLAEAGAVHVWLTQKGVAA